MNIAAALQLQAQRQPDTIAMHYPQRRFGRSVTWRSISYAELDSRSTRIAAGLAEIGLQPGTKTVLMVKPGLEFFLLMYGLFKLGAVPVLIDPGIQRAALRQCLDEAEPEVFIGIPLAQFARQLLGWARPHLRQLVTVGRRWCWGGHTLATVERRGAANVTFQVRACAGEELAAILFTSGSTGVPKGVEYQHRHFAAQVELLRAAFEITPGGVNLPTFPPFALFDPALGLTSVIPTMDARHPARADPAELIATLRRFRCDMMFGSPALVKVLSEHAHAHGEHLEGLTRVISAGAPVPPQRVARMLAVLPIGARMWTPYGATEALPVAVVEASTLLGPARARTASGAGICVGHPVSGNQVRIIRIDDGALPDWADVLELAAGEIGEIWVRGPSVTAAYHGRAAATALAKTRDRDGTIGHRMGDLGYFDADGCLWFCGRKAERVHTPERLYFTECAEQIFNTDAAVARSAVVGIGNRPVQRAVVCIERLSGDSTPWATLVKRLQELAERFEASSGLVDFVEHPGFPVDIRHNAKIGRPALALWASEHLPMKKAGS